MITDGKHGDCNNQPDSGYYFLSCKDVRGGKLNYEGSRQITEQDFQDTHRRTQLEPSDILITNSGTIGRMAIAADHDLTRRTTFQKSVAIIKPNHGKVDFLWLYYYLMAEVDRLIAFAGGTAQKNLLLRDMRAFEIDVPRREIQRQIASVLSAYDDLIENNRRRIEVLEEMARRLYEEWFVHFRFPAHETVKMVDGELNEIPEGWELWKLGDLLVTLESGSRPKGGIDPSERGVPSIGAENINGLGKYDYSKEKFVSPSFFEGMKRGHVRSGDVLLYKDGAHVGRKALFRDGYPHEVCAVNEHVFILRPNETITPTWLYFCLDRPEMTGNIRNLNANAAQPGINQKSVKSLDIVLPPVPLIRQFSAIAEPLMGLLFNLAKRNRALRRTRDLLLPKLISGEIDVSEVEDLETGAAE